VPLGDSFKGSRVEQAHGARLGETDAALPAKVGEDPADGLGRQP
jgi:hypothetical protein